MIPGLVLFALAALALGDPPNVLLIIADDLGVDRVGVYAEHPEPGRTPVIDGLAADGLLFRNAWSQPICSPTRAALLTGRHAVRTGLGTTIYWEGSYDELAVNERSVADLLNPSHHTAAVGKWHLTAANLTGLDHPAQLGFANYRGNMQVWPGTTGGHYFRHERVVDGVSAPSSTYSTTESVDDALDLIEGFGSDPWFVWLAFNAPHTPIHRPPDHLHTYDEELPGNAEDDLVMHGLAMVEAMDTEIGRLLASMDPAVLADTYVVFVGDNGTSPHMTAAPWQVAHAKPSVFEGGLNVPLIVRGPGIASGTESPALVTVTDLFATILELAQAPLPSNVDAISMAPYLVDPGLPTIREHVYAERFLPNGAGPKSIWKRAARDERFKLIRLQDIAAVEPDVALLFDLDADPFEQTNLLDAPLSAAAQTSFDALSAVMDALEVHVELPQPGWTDLGYGMPGVNGVPELSGTGPIIPGTFDTVTLTGGAPDAPLFLGIGLAPIFAPFFGGIFVPLPAEFLLLATDGAGGLAGPIGWPADLPVGTEVWFQAWILDEAAVEGFAGSNALVARVP